MKKSSLSSEVLDFMDKSTLWDFFSVKGPGYEQLHSFLQGLKNWRRREAGESYQGQVIYAYHTGNRSGKKVLLWSQMHGNEPFSTYALALAMEFLSHDNQLAQNIRDRLSLVALPMLNPDGAVKLMRRNAQGIDINRDARRLTSPEAQILHREFKALKAQYCFNLHDQEIYYAPQGGQMPTQMAFLVPAADQANSLTPARRQGMDILGFVLQDLNLDAPAKYNDAFMLTAFGDYFSSLGSVTMLLETGFFIGDENRRLATLVHARAIILALYRIANQDNADYSQVYNSLPFNQKYAFFDFILKNVILTGKNSSYKVDIAISRKDRFDPERFAFHSNDLLVFDIGDLEGKKAFHVIDTQEKILLPMEKVFLYAPANWIIENELKF